MKAFTPIVGLLILSTLGCRQTSRETTHVEVAIESVAVSREATEVRLNVDRAMSAAMTLLASDAYASEVRRRLSKDDLRLLPSEGDLRARLSLTVDGENSRIRIGFVHPDSEVAERVVALYKECIGHFPAWVVDPGFRALSLNESGANPSSSAQRP